MTGKDLKDDNKPEIAHDEMKLYSQRQLNFFTGLHEEVFQRITHFTFLTMTGVT